MKTDFFSSPVVNDEFSKFIELLSAILKQHHVIFRILSSSAFEFHHLYSLFFIYKFIILIGG